MEQSEQLEALSPHPLRMRRSSDHAVGRAQPIRRADDGRFLAAGDPRSEGAAIVLRRSE